MVRFGCAALVVGAGLALGGCGTLSPTAPPSCDGYARRPLNRSLWNWEAGLAAPPPPDVVPTTVFARPVQRLGAGKPSGTAPTVVADPSPRGGAPSDQQAHARPRAFDVAGSYAACS